MARNATPTPISKEVAVNETAIVEDQAAQNQLAAMTMEANTNAMAVAHQVGYQGTMTIGALEDEIRFYQRRTVEALLETGKRLLVLKELTPHGMFAQRVEMLGFAKTTAHRFMQAAAKTAKSSKLELLSSQVKSTSAFLELVTHDDDVLENLSEMDDIDRLSATELRARLRETVEEKTANDKLLENKNKQIDQLQRANQRIKTLPADEAAAGLRQDATRYLNEAQGMVRGNLRAALQALQDGPDAEGAAMFMAGMVGQLMTDLMQLREQFNLPDVVGDGRPEWERWAEKQAAGKGATAETAE
ncbi:MAG: hypothetical protein RSD57_00050 [Comamonas sp.]